MPLSGALRPVPGATSPEERQQLGNWLMNLVQAGQTEKGALPDRWEINDAHYRNQPPKWSNRLLPGCEMMHFPLVQPKIDRLAGTTVRTITSPEPMLLAELRGSGRRLEDLESTFQFFHEIGNIDQRLRMLGTMTGCTDNAVMRVMFDAVSSESLASHPEHVVQIPGLLNYVGFRYEVFHPGDFVLHPATPYGVLAARISGHRFWQRVADVKEKQRDGRYFKDVDIAGGAGPESYYAGRDWGFSRLTPVVGPGPDDSLVECWDVIFKKALEGDNRERRYRAVFVYGTGQLLMLERFHYRPWYREFRYKDVEYGGFWASRSVAQDLQGLQTAYNHLNNLLVYGSYHAAFPAVFGANLPAKALKYMAGDVINADGEKVTVVKNDFNPAAIPLMIQKIEEIADSVVRFSQAAMGQQFKSGTTAYEVSELIRGQSANDNDYLQNFGAALLDIADMEREQLFYNFAYWYPLYRGQTPLEGREILAMPVRWNLQGKNPNATPEAQLVKFEALLEKAEMYPDLIDVVEVLRSYVNSMELSNGKKIMPDELVTTGAGQGLSGGDVIDLVPRLLEVARASGFGDAASEVSRDAASM